MRKSGTQFEEVQDYDAVVVAGGHYDLPYVPDIGGLAAWKENYPGAVTHSKSYRRPDSFKDKVGRIHCFSPKLSYVFGKTGLKKQRKSSS